MEGLCLQVCVPLGSHPADPVHQAGPELGDPGQPPQLRSQLHSWLLKVGPLTKNLGSRPLWLLKVPKDFTSCSLPASQLPAGLRGPYGRAQGTGVGILARRQAGGLCLWQPGDLLADPQQRPVRQKKLGLGPRLSAGQRQP